QGRTMVDINLDSAGSHHSNRLTGLADNRGLIEGIGGRVWRDRVAIDFNAVGGTGNATLVGDQLTIHGQQALLAPYDL
ncbi:hypothetical protein KQH89_19780, partial [Vibrio cholerae]|uniref:hypothetical protein n=1 Tax=Vibrio cholerae TaxID=666 RepID=UPI001C105965